VITWVFRKDFDHFMFWTTIVLMCFGSLAIWSADGGGPIDIDNLGVRQGVYGLLGLGLMLTVANLDYRFFASFAWPIYGIAVAMLALVLVPGVGVEILGARRWFDLRIATVQPSEFAKLATVIALATFIASRGAAMRQPGNFLISLFIAGVPMLLVFQQPDLGSSLVFAVIWISMILVAQTRRIYLAGMALLTAPTILIVWEFFLQPYQRARWLVFLDPMSDPTDQGFNIIQARISIGSGSWFGFGLEGGTQSRLGLLAVRESDFIFAHASGMFGFLGMLAVMASLSMLLWRCLIVVESARNNFGQCVALGIAGMLFFQSFVNIGMNVGLMPVTGITLPFVSSGLSSLWSFLLAEGLLQSIRMRHRKLAFQPS
jgi:rod shape determining protein RodA